MTDSYLAGHPIFGQVPPQERDGRFQEFRLHADRAGVPIFEEGENSKDQAFLLRSGLVKLVKYSPRLEPLTVETVVPGVLFGLVVAFDKDPYLVSAIPLCDCEVYRIPAGVLKGIAQDYPAVAQGLYAQLGDRLLHFYAMQSLAKELVEKRIAYLLCKLCEAGPKDISVRREDIASMVASTPGTAIRVLASFKKKKLIASGWKRITVLDFAGLKSLSGYDSFHLPS